MTFDYAALEAAGIEQVTIDYHGSGDEGWIEDIHAIPSDDIPRDLYQAIELAARDVLYDHFGGWEINEGSAGTMTIHVLAGKTDIHHGWKVETSQYEDKEIS
jgi:hypothetical protein